MWRCHCQVLKVRELEEFNMNRKVSGPRKAYVKTFMEWMEKNGAKIDGVEIADFGDQGLFLSKSSPLFLWRASRLFLRLNPTLHVEVINNYLSY